MSESLNIDLNLSDEEKYKVLLPQIENLISNEDSILSNLSNITAVLKEAFPKISWVGFYLFKDDKLHLGPFQGKLACTQIKMGSGVCGTAASKNETVLVENVHDFPGHIACDSGSNSEIVIPISSNGQIFGVLDLDSYEHSAFNKTDKIYLEKIVEILSIKLDLQLPLL